MRLCIGIVSYLPDTTKARLERQARLNRLTKQINELFPKEINILFIAQNWKDFKVNQYSQKIIKYSYDRLGILKARHTLREKFLEGNYDYLVMFDDDAIIQATPQKINEYIKLMENNPKGWCFIKGSDPNGYADSQLNLCAISRYIYLNQAIPNIDPQKSEGFEDRIFSCILKNCYSNLEFNEPVGIRCIHFKNEKEVVESTWANEKQFNWKYMRARTVKIEEYIRKNKKLPDLRFFYSKLFFENELKIKDFNSKYHFMQLWGDCSGLGYLGDLRFRGPVDNVYSVSEKNIELLLNNQYFNYIRNTKPKIYDSKIWFDGDLGKTFEYETVKLLHNDPSDENYLASLQKRVDTFNTFYNNLKYKDNYFFTINFNKEIVNSSTNTFKNEKLLLAIIATLKKYNILHKTIFIGLTQKYRKTTSNMHIKNFDSKKYGINYIEIWDNDVWDTTGTHLQFIDKFMSLKNNTIVDPIDLVVPYVDSTDPIWLKLFNQYNPNKDKEIEEVNAKNRFRGQGDFFRFFFRGIETNLPWIRNIYLLVQNKTQVPKWLDTSKIKGITHAEFIPKEYLPTFNSCTIELFLWNIPDISQKFIYTNDDVFILNKINLSDFIENGKIKETVKHNRLDGMFGQHCDNVNKLIFGNLNNFIRPTHGLRFYLKSELIKCYNAYKTELNQSITKFRAPNNFNCFVYNLWQAKQKLTINPGIPCEYMTKCNIAALNSATTVCINDTDPDLNIYSDINLITWFYHKLSKKSRFELTDYKPKLVEKRTMADGRPGCYLYF